MSRFHKSSALLPALSLVLFTCGTIGFSAGAIADEPPPPATTPAPGPGGGKHHNPAYAACKKQADDQKLAAGDARKTFMKNCIKSTQGTPPAT
jgi:hypothetical protein